MHFSDPREMKATILINRQEEREREREREIDKKAREREGEDRS
jgi:hypothetical protein